MIPKVLISSEYLIQGVLGNIFPVDGKGNYQIELKNVSTTLKIMTREDLNNDIFGDSNDKRIQVIDMTSESLDYESSSRKVCQTSSCTGNQTTDSSMIETLDVERIVFWRLSYQLASMSMLKQELIDCISGVSQKK